MKYVAILFTVYYFSLAPLLTGFLYNKIIKKDEDLLYTYLKGYITYIALFFIVMLFPIINGVSVDNALKIGRIYSVVIGCAGAVICFKDIIGIILSLKDRFSEDKRFIIIIMIITISITFISVLCFLPSIFDETVENARFSYITERIGLNKDFESFSYIFFMVGNGGDLEKFTKVLHIIVPIFMLTLFVCAYERLGEYFFGRKTKQSEWFVYSAILFYFIQVFTYGNVAMTPFMNIWNGKTFAVTIIFPLILMYVMDLAKLIIRKVYDNKAETISMLIICVISACFSYKYSWIMCLLSVIISIVIERIGQKND